MGDTSAIMEGFKKNPSKKMLKDNLNTIYTILIKSGQGYTCSIKNGVAVYEEKDGKEIEIGELQYIKSVITDLFGENASPEGVEYIIMDDFCYVTYYGQLIACGAKGDFDSTSIKRGVNDFSNFINSGIGGIIKSFIDVCFEENVLEGISFASNIMAEMFLLKQNKNVTNVDDALSALENSLNFDSSGYSSDVIALYKDIAELYAAKGLVQLLIVDLEINGYAVMEDAKLKNEDAIVIWSDGSSSLGGSEGIKLCSISEGFSIPEVYIALYNAFRDRLPEDELLNIKNVDLNADGVIEASKAVQVDPLIIDLNQNNIYTTSLEEGTYYDYQEDGMKEKTAWADAGDGFLVRDLNKNEIIDEAGEFFGDRTLLEEGGYAKDGFEALAQYDENKDGVIDSQDTVFAELKIWKDDNGNGITDEGELHDLSEWRIQSIGIVHGIGQTTDANGNILYGQNKVYTESGDNYGIGSVGFVTNTMDTVLEGEIEVPDTIFKLMPNLKGSGNVRTLHQAMALDNELYEMVREYIETQDSKMRKQLSEQILTRWTGCGSEIKGSRGFYIDATHLAVIEAFYGTNFIGINGSNPNNSAGSRLEKVYQDLLGDMQNKLLMLTFGMPCFFQTIYIRDEITGKSMIDIFSSIDKVCEVYSQDMQTAYDVLSAYVKVIIGSGFSVENIVIEGLDEKLDSIGFGSLEMLLGDGIIKGGSRSFIKGTIVDDVIYAQVEGATVNAFAGKDVIYGSTGNEIFYSGGDDDTVYAGIGNDTIYGEDGNDRLYGDYGNDTLIGGAGDDYLSGGAGSDIYVYNLGDGNDTIYNYDTSEGRKLDRLIFGEGIKAEDIQAERKGDDMLLTNVRTGEVITVQKMFYYCGSTNERYYLENIEFADGTVWNREILMEKLKTRRGTGEADYLVGYDEIYGYSQEETFLAGAGDDTVYGRYGNDTIYGENGNDRLYGDYGNDTLIGGAGDDYLSGGYGSDTYIWNVGDGNDTINNYDTDSASSDSLVIGTNAENLIFTRNGQNLLISILGSSDSITIQNWYQNDYYKVENIQTSDGYSLSYKQVDLLIQSMSSFESSSGMSWAEGVALGNDNIEQITSQFWMKQVG